LQDTDWLKNKMRALSHLFCTSPGDDDDSRQLLQTSITCEYALAARLLLEEQELDGGQSNGKSGKLGVIKMTIMAAAGTVAR
jgi:hypothetical protein